MNQLYVKRQGQCMRGTCIQVAFGFTFIIDSVKNIFYQAQGICGKQNQSNHELLLILLTANW